MRKLLTLLVMALIALPASAAEPVTPIKPRPSLQPRKLELPSKRLPTATTPQEEAASTEQPAEPPAEPPAEQAAETQPAAPSPVTITGVEMNISTSNCQYRWTISFRNDSDAPLTNLLVGGKQKGPHLNTFHGAGAVLVSSLAPGQELSKTVGWARDIRATDFYVYVAQSETNELATQPYSIPAISASIGQISFAPQSGNSYGWSAEINNSSTIPICDGVTIVRKRLANQGMEMGAVTKGLTFVPGSNTVSGTWDASNATGFNLRLSADSGAARGMGVWMLDEKEVPFTP
jgi:hypothetical protein